MISSAVESSKSLPSGTSFWREVRGTFASYMLWGAAAFVVSSIAYAMFLWFKSLAMNRNLVIGILASLVALKGFSGIYADFRAAKSRFAGSTSLLSLIPTIFVEAFLSLAMTFLSPRFVALLRKRR